MVLGNLIGTDITGIVKLGNSYGVDISRKATGNTVGGTSSGAANVISGNNVGVELYGSGTSGNVVLGNLIGTDINGTAQLGNTDYGVIIEYGPSENTLGGASSGSANVISGNIDGVELYGSGTSGNVVLGNLIGTDIHGTAKLGNTNDGVEIYTGVTGNTVGGTSSGAANVISGNTTGVELYGSGTSGNVVLGNLIGTDINGTANLGNTNDGVLISNASTANTFGGTAANAGNTIAFNAKGVVVNGSTSTGDSILGNSIFSNAGLGIDLGGPPANNGQTAPDITSASGTTVSGTLSSTKNTTFRLEFFASPAGSSSQGQTFLGSVSVTTDINGNASFSATLSLSIPAGSVVTATATNLTSGDTSEFSTYAPISPSLTVSTNSLNLGTTTAGTVGSTQSYTVSGSNLTANVYFTAPSGVELSSDNGSTWHSSLTLTENGGVLGSTTIDARISAAATAGSISGNISNTSSGATEQDVAVSGTVTPVVTSSSANLAVTATSLTINGIGFSTTASNDTVSFSGGVTGTVTSATSTQLTVTGLSGLVLGNLTVSVTVSGISSGTAVQVATVVPVVTSNTANLPVNSTSLTINGFGFSTTASNNTVTFSGGATGTVTAASSTQLTVTSLSGLAVGSLNASVTVSGVSSGGAVQVATVIPVVASSSANLPITATSLTINGFGFSTTAGNDTVSFSGGVTGTVTSASGTQLTVTSLSGLAVGNLNASVSVNGVSSGTAVQVATVVSAGPVVTPSSANLPVTATSLTINGSGFSTTATNNIVSFSGGVSGTVTSASSTQLTVTSLSGLAVGNLTASVTINGVSSGTAVRVATVIPVVASSSANLPITATSLTINGFGFSTTAGNDTVSFSGGVTGTVTSASGTQLTVTSLSGLVLGNLNASVSVNGVSSGAAVQVATLVSSASSVTNVQIDDGTKQRSMVRSITLTFSSNIASTLSSVMAGLSLTRASDGLAVALKGTLDSSGTVLTLTFTGSSIIGGSLADGRYTLVFGSTTLLSSSQLWRLFGDLNGTASVTAADETAFNAAMNSRKGMSNYSAYLDYNEDGLIVNSDQTAFLQRLGTSI